MILYKLAAAFRWLMRRFGPKNEFVYLVAVHGLEKAATLRDSLADREWDSLTLNEIWKLKDRFPGARTRYELGVRRKLYMASTSREVEKIYDSTWREGLSPGINQYFLQQAIVLATSFRDMKWIIQVPSFDCASASLELMKHAHSDSQLRFIIENGAGQAVEECRMKLEARQRIG